MSGFTSAYNTRILVKQKTGFKNPGNMSTTPSKVFKIVVPLKRDSLIFGNLQLSS